MTTCEGEQKEIAEKVKAIAREICNIGINCKYGHENIGARIYSVNIMVGLEVGKLIKARSVSETCPNSCCKKGVGYKSK